ncbi:MAG TPA: TonB family protein [Candidatus Babeliaceae bacterium]|nr:TonB family protein [Candidatus Babeliaceae bacterium]
MKLLALFSLFILPILSFAQTDTTYYTRSNEITVKAGAYYYRLMHTTESGEYAVSNYYLSGKLLMTGMYNCPDLDISCMNGKFIYYDTAGFVKSEAAYSSGKRTQIWKTYYPHSNMVWVTYDYSKSQGAVELCSFYKDGHIKRKETQLFSQESVVSYREGKITDGTCYDEQGNIIDFTPFVFMAHSPYDIKDFLARNLNYPESARLHNISGKVVIGFDILEDGSITNVRIEKSLDEECDKEAMRVVSGMPKWEPYMIDDVPRTMHFTLPINFALK